MKSIGAVACIAFALTLVTPVAHCDELADRLAAVSNPRDAGVWISDPANVIARRKDEINRLIGDLERETSAEVAVVVLPTIGRLVPKDFAVALLAKWGVGKAGKDNGVLVLHILDQRRIEIETGYGMEGILPDAKCHWITEEIAVPYFKKDSFADGHYEVIRALAHAIKQPDISHQNLVSGLTTQPGATVDPVPDIPARDTIALKYAGLPERFFYSALAPIVLLAIGIALYFVIAAAFRSRSQGRSLYEKYNLYNGAGTKLQYAAGIPAAASAYVAEYAHNGTFFSVAPAFVGALLLTFWRRRRVLKELRDTPRTCECGKTMRRLSEQDDNAHIATGNVAEETLGSMDYDVWVCDCGKSSIEAYKGSTAAEICPTCRFKTYRVTASHIVTAATTVSTGLRSVTSSCANCGRTDTRTHVIPRVSTSSSSSGSSGRSGGSFGGGRSGGGGAGSSY
jgi:uncharacterized protein